MKELEHIISLLRDVMNTLIQLQEGQPKKDDLVMVYLDSAGKVINQPNVVMVYKRPGMDLTKTVCEQDLMMNAVFRNGMFKESDDAEPSWEMDYDYAINNYWITQPGERIACYKKDCLFNKYKGCTIKPSLTIGGNWGVNCDSYISRKD